MIKPPCIRGLREFKKGCPQKKWDGESGCPAWIDVRMPTLGGTKFIEIKECLDLYRARLHYSTNALLEGNQRAVETFRNNMSTEAGPKPDPALVKTLEVVQSHLKTKALIDLKQARIEQGE